MASEETREGAAACNDVRVAGGLPPLQLEVVGLLAEGAAPREEQAEEEEEAEDDEEGGEDEEEDEEEGATPPLAAAAAAPKLSSSSLRAAELGRFLPRAASREWVRRRPAGRPYVVGLTGGIAAGKSTAAAELRALGADCLDADKARRLPPVLPTPSGAAPARHAPPLCFSELDAPAPPSP